MLLKVLCLIACTVPFTVMTVSAQTSTDDLWNSGSVFAAGIECETKGYMREGQVVPLMTAFLKRAAPAAAQSFRYGYQEGMKRTAIYSQARSGWFPYPQTEAGCSHIQKAINQYKIAFDALQ
ncbi:hypothetical protein [Bradyrhizobium paxllaeri]|uniref:hypothetical protein n=1 Tax=Bradyrhizobium paxllaeri TaxID=190148 RepID=UPI0011474436|nr:hypothetical protein [Bradyrhizobium paxllaeri]